MSLDSHYYTTAQAASYLGYKVNTIRRFVRDGKLVPVNTIGHSRFTKASLDLFARRGRTDLPASLKAAMEPTLHPAILAAMSK